MGQCIKRKRFTWNATFYFKMCTTRVDGLKNIPIPGPNPGPARCYLFPRNLNPRVQYLKRGFWVGFNMNLAAICPISDLILGI